MLLNSLAFTMTVATWHWCGRFILLLLSAFLLWQALSPASVTKRFRQIGLGWLVPWRRWQQNLVLSSAILSLAFCVLLFGILGNLPLGNAAAITFSHVEFAFYSAIQVLTFDNEPSVNNRLLLFAADCAIALAIVVVIELLRKLFRDTFLTMAYRLPCFRRTIICGLGRIGQQVMEDIAEEGWLIVIETDPDNPSLERARELGATIVTGDARSEKLLRWVGAHYAKAVYLVTGKDEANAEAVLDLAELVNTRRWYKSRPVPQCYVQISNMSLAQMIRRNEAIVSSGLQKTLIFFDALQNAVDELITQHLPYCRPAKDQVAHFVVWGFGEMGRRVALALAEYGHFENLKRSRITILYAQDEEENVREFCRTFPNFGPVAVTQQEGQEFDGWTFPEEADEWGSQHLRPLRQFDGPNVVEYVANAAFVPQPSSCYETEFIERLKQITNDPRIHPVAIVCSEKDQQNATLAEGLYRAFQQYQLVIPTFVWIPVQPRLAELIESISKSGEEFASALIPFGQAQRCCSVSAIRRPLRAGLAEAIHAAYEISFNEDAASVPRLAEVEDFDLYWSNFSTATHAPLKLAVLGLEVQTKLESEGRTVVSREEVEKAETSSAVRETIAAMEHHRWMAERLLRDWRYEVVAPELDPYTDDSDRRKAWREYKKRMTQRRTRHQFIPFDQLHEKEGVKDIDQVALLLKYCSGYYDERFSLTPLRLVKLDRKP